MLHADSFTHTNKMLGKFTIIQSPITATKVTNLWHSMIHHTHIPLRFVSIAVVSAIVDLVISRAYRLLKERRACN